jgi:hypothetical protein
MSEKTSLRTLTSWSPSLVPSMCLSPLVTPRDRVPGSHVLSLGLSSSGNPRNYLSDTLRPFNGPCTILRTILKILTTCLRPTYNLFPLPSQQTPLFCDADVVPELQADLSNNQLKGLKKTFPVLDYTRFHYRMLYKIKP